MAHTIEQPGLHAHSWNSETDLMKRWVVYTKTPGMLGRLALRSFDHFDEAWKSLPETTNEFVDGFYRLVDADGGIWSVEMQF